MSLIWIVNILSVFFLCVFFAGIVIPQILLIAFRSSVAELRLSFIHEVYDAYAIYVSVTIIRKQVWTLIKLDYYILSYFSCIPA